MKNYDPAFHSLIEAVKADKDIAQPWRNKVVSRLDEVQAILEKGQRMTNIKPPVGTPEPLHTPTGEPMNCVCPEGAIDTACPVHGK